MLYYVEMLAVSCGGNSSIFLDEYVTHLPPHPPGEKQTIQREGDPSSGVFVTKVWAIPPEEESDYDDVKYIDP
jgi:hypothetical protein